MCVIILTNSVLQFSVPQLKAKCFSYVFCKHLLSIALITHYSEDENIPHPTPASIFYSKQRKRFDYKKETFKIKSEIP